MNAGRPANPRPRQRRGVAPESDLGFNWGPLNTVLLALGVVFLAVGYLTLSRGSITLAPVLLVSAYCVLIPASLLLRGRKAGSGE